MAMTFISTTTVGSSGAANIEFTNIPQTGKDLLILLSCRSSRGTTTDELIVEINRETLGDSSLVLRGTGSAASSTTVSNEIFAFQPGSTATANTFSNSAVYLSNYAGNTAKSVSTDNVTENNATAVVLALVAGVDTDTDAISSIRLRPSGANTFVQHSSASLYIIS